MDAQTEKNRVALGSMIAAVLLTTFKLLVGLLTGSLGILSEALHSALDLVAAAITWLAVRVSDKPADNYHHYGHGKIENLSALVETVLLFVTSFWIIYEASARLIAGHTEIELSPWAYVVVIGSIVIDFTRSRALMRVAKKYNSQALEADALHFSTDILSSAVVLLGLVAAQFGVFWADSVAALAVALIVLVVAYRLGQRAVNVLLDRAPLDTSRKICDYLNAHTVIKQFHSLRIRSAGADTFVDVTIHVEPSLTVVQAHEIANNLENDIRRIIERGSVVVHAEPHGKHPGHTGESAKE